MESEAYIGSKMVCSAHGFPKLEILILERLVEVKEWKIEEGAMPCLNTLHVKGLPKLQMIPEGLKFVTTLRELKLSSMSSMFKKRVGVENGVEGEDFHKIRHIPSLTID